MEQILSVALDRLVVSPTNPRKHFPEDSINEMANSLKNVGLIEPLVVRSNHKLPDATDKFEIVCGERRFRAAGRADLHDLLCIVKELTDDQVFEIQISENLHREDVSPLDEADAFHSLMQRKHLSLNEVAFKFGKSEEYIFGRIRLINLIKNGREHLENGVLPVTAAIKISTLSERLQNEAIKRTITLSEVNGERVFVFAGLRELKSFFQHNVMLPLLNVDFDVTDAELCATAGACTQCLKRTGAGLFKEFVDSDKCLDSDCYKTKLVTHYIALKETLSKKIKQPIVFCANGYNTEKEFKELDPLTMFEWNMVDQEKLIEKDKRDLHYGIMVGIKRHVMEEEDEEDEMKHGYVQITKRAEAVVKKTVTKEEQIKENRKQEQDKLSAILYNECIFNQFKKTGLKSLHSISATMLAASLMDETQIAPTILLDIAKRYGLELKVSIHNGNQWEDLVLSKEFDGVINEDMGVSTCNAECFDAIDGLDIKKIMCLMNELIFLSSIRNEETLKIFVDEFELDVKAAKKEANALAKQRMKDKD